MEEVLAKMNQLESIILSVKDELERKMDHDNETTRTQIEELRQENRTQIEQLRLENEEQHKQMYLQICGKMILENTKLERKIRKEIQNQFAMEKAKNVEKVRRLNNLDSRIEKNESDIMLCQNEISEMKKSIV